MPGIRIVCAAFVAAMAVALAAYGAQAQTPSEPVGKPLALLAGLRPPPEPKHRVSKHAVHTKAEHTAFRKAAAGTRHGGVAAARARHASAKKLARRKYEHHERAVTASAFAEESPPQPEPDPPALPHWPGTGSNSTPVEDAAARQVIAPATGDTRRGAETDPDLAALEVQTIKITAPNPAGVAAASDSATGAPITGSQTVLAASTRESANNPPAGKTTDPVGSASWIAQVLAALGGAVVAGAVAWFLIGGGPVRTYS